MGDRGNRHYGLGLARHLAAHGQQIAEIDAARHVGKRRAGKSDAIDAVRAARELLARPHPAQTTGALSWRKASYSTGNGGNCVEVAGAPRTVAVRDSKDPHGPALAFTPGRWQEFTRAVKTGAAHR